MSTTLGAGSASNPKSVLQLRMQDGLLFLESAAPTPVKPVTPWTILKPNAQPPTNKSPDPAMTLLRIYGEPGEETTKDTAYTTHEILFNGSIRSDLKQSTWNTPMTKAQMECRVNNALLGLIFVHINEDDKFILDNKPLSGVEGMAVNSIGYSLRGQPTGVEVLDHINIFGKIQDRAKSTTRHSERMEVLVAHGSKKWCNVNVTIYRAQAFSPQEVTSLAFQAARRGRVFGIEPIREADRWAYFRKLPELPKIAPAPTSQNPEMVLPCFAAKSWMEDRKSGSSSRA